MRWGSAFAHDLRFQWRHGFYGVYLLVCLLYLLLLHFVPTDVQASIAILLTFSDPSAVGLILAGGIILLEKDQAVHDQLFATPLRVPEYLLAKAMSIGVLSTCAAWVIHGFSLGVPASPILFSLSVMLSSSFFTFLSIGVVTRARSINGFVLLSQVYALPFALPLLYFFGIGRESLYLIFPTHGSLLLLESAIRTLSWREIIYAVAILTLWNGIAFLFAQRSFERRILGRIDVDRRDRR
ncbi:fluoroquinolone export ABC transporter permease subunit [Paenibacillus guangzhouensis]|uniref:fluoroquinolone export ABC transporter permease subunit n=1 Tax=Paenibacillus guangzhouensis TaxID=1473112 RepID=UPI00126758B0|nr:ABC transporter permease [Paenibacillus guangzhouensis]